MRYPRVRHSYYYPEIITNNAKIINKFDSGKEQEILKFAKLVNLKS